MNLQKLIETLEDIVEDLVSLPSTLIAYYDDLYGYPISRWVMMGLLLSGSAIYLAIFECVQLIR